VNLLDDLKALLARHAEQESEGSASYSELHARHAVMLAIADNTELPKGARYESNGVSYWFWQDGQKVFGYANYFQILDAVIDRRIASALELDRRHR